ncbi:hypothetical protein HanLR1_Chr03g0078681 [Helianthus annuus]|nr:hypothetical protein HanLR1_Chr03g0078681 [Helianthus annuus]
MMEEDSQSSETEHQETEPHNHSKFSKSLQELKDLCSQLHAAAGYCESNFLSSNHKSLSVFPSFCVFFILLYIFSLFIVPEVWVWLSVSSKQLFCIKQFFTFEIFCHFHPNV